MKHSVETVTVNDSPMEIYTYLPDGDGPHPGLVVAMHIPLGHTGIENDPFTQKVCERYCEAGYAVACPFIFHYWPKEDDITPKREGFRDDWATADYQAAFDWLAGQGSVDAERIGVVGHCWGGRVSWLAAVNNPKYKACAVFYGGRIKVAMGPNTPPPIELADKMPCPVLGLFGNNDKGPSPEDVADYSAALTAAGVEHDFTGYDGAGHGFQDFNAPDRYNEKASDDAWGKALAFFNDKLT